MHQIQLCIQATPAVSLAGGAIQLPSADGQRWLGSSAALEGHQRFNGKPNRRYKTLHIIALDLIPWGFEPENMVLFDLTTGCIW